MNSRPIVLRFASGSVTPSSAARNASDASRWTRRMLKRSRKVATTSSASLCRIRPWSTKMQVSWSPIASWISTAATDESTPPDRPQMTRPLPTSARMRAISVARKPAIVQSPLRPATLKRKLREERRAVRRVHHLRMEHRCVIAALLVRCDRIGRVLRHRIDPEALGQARHAVAMAHPNRVAPTRSPHPVEQCARLEDLDVGPPELRRVAGPRPCRRAARTRSAGRSRWRGWGRRR